MKLTHIITAAFIGIALVGCKNEPIPTRQQWDPDAKVSIRPASIAKAGNMSYETALTIVKRTNEVKFWNDKVEPFGATGFGMGPAGKDTISAEPCLKVPATFIISQRGTYEPAFIEGWDMVLTEWSYTGYPSPLPNVRWDTLAYIPNQTLRDAEAKIKECLARKDTASVYGIFDKAFIFLPITGEEWRALKAQGKN